MPYLLSLLLLLCLPAQAADVSLRVMGSWDMLSQYQEYEAPFWQQELPRLSDGRMQAEVQAFNKAGLKGSEVVRLMKLGMVDVGTAVLSYISADDPVVEGADLAGMADSLPLAHRIADAYLPELDQYYRERHGIHVLALWPYSAQMLMCRKPLAGIQDLKGRRVRVSLRTSSDLIERFGALTLNIPFDETYQRLQRGEADCLITGTYSAYTAGFHKVVHHLYDFSLGWSVMMLGINENVWQSLTPQDQQVLQQGTAGLSERLWQAADSQTRTGIQCMSGQSACPAPPDAPRGQMVVHALSAADRARIARALQESVLPRWAERCGKRCVDNWQRSAGRVLNPP